MEELKNIKVGRCEDVNYFQLSFININIILFICIYYAIKNYINIKYTVESCDIYFEIIYTIM